MLNHQFVLVTLTCKNGNEYHVVVSGESYALGQIKDYDDKGSKDQSPQERQEREQIVARLEQDRVASTEGWEFVVRNGHFFVKEERITAERARLLRAFK